RVRPVGCDRMLRHEADDQAAEIIGLLDEFRAAERAGAEAVDHWVTVCRDARLRGGLKVIRTRDRGHACLAEERLRALGGTPSAHVGRQLASLRAAEAAGAAVVDAWVAVCPLPSLRGGLRTIAEREAGHAALLEERLRELGGTCDAVVPDAMRGAAVGRFGSPAVADEEKLA